VAAGRLGQPDAEQPVTLKYDNGEGLTFRRTIAIATATLHVKDDVTNIAMRRSRFIRSR